MMLARFFNMIVISLTGWLFSVGVSQETNTNAVLAAATAYVKAYESTLSSVVAKETYIQQIASLVPNDQSIPRYRKMTGEVFFMFAPGGDEWMAVRDLEAVDGSEIKNRLNVLEELKKLPVQNVVAAFKTHNSKFNIGRTFRNFNEPTLTLRVFADAHRNRFTFQHKRIEKRRDGNLVVLSFTETSGPSLIQDMTYGLTLSSGEAVIDPASGRIHRTLLKAAIGPVRLEMSTDYVLDPRLDIFVPDRFRERYQHGVQPRSIEADGEYEDISCEARYTNYRRFETSARIKR